MFLSIVIPCLNEAESIPGVIEDTLRAKKNLLQLPEIEKVEVIVVNDGSTDNSLNLLRNNAQVKVASNNKPQGYGAAIKKGIQRARGDFVAIYDMDNTYPPSSLLKMVKKIREDNKFVVGYRQHSNSGMPLLRGFGNSFFQNLIQKLFKSSIKDPCSGMWVFEKKYILSILDQLPNKLHFTLYLSLYLIKNKIKFEEVAIDYLERTGDSKLNPVTDGLVFFYTIIKSRYSAL